MLVLALLAGCHGRGGPRGGTSGVDGDPGGDGGASNGDAVAFMRDYGHAVCEYYRRCQLKIADTWLWAWGQELCHPGLLEQWLASYEPFLSRGRYTVDTSAAEACLLALREGPCVDVPANSLPCREAFVGSQPVGGECASDLECPDHARCELGSTCPGTCLETLGTTCQSLTDCGLGETCLEERCQPPLAERASCRGDSDCALPLRCLGDFGASTCMTKRSENEECGYGLDCAGELHCVRDASLGTSVCKQPLPAGSPCNEATACLPDHYCDHDLGVCQPRVGDGSACSPSSYCPIWSACIDGVCAPMPLAGESCGGGASCLQGLCESGSCSLVSDGGECFDSWECAGYCSPGGTCAPKLPEGSRCLDDWDCAEGLECRRSGSDGTCAPICT